MKATLIISAGAVIVLATFLVWHWFNAFACGMNPTGCGGVSLAWHDWEALRMFIPTFVIGLGMVAWGTWLKLKR